MRMFWICGASLLAVLAFATGQARAAAIPTCDRTQLLGYAPSDDEVNAHRPFALPVIDYPFGAEMSGALSMEGTLDLTLRTDEDGKVVCYGIKPDFGHERVPDERQRVLIDGLGGWRYKPFAAHGKPVAAVFQEQIHAQELPKEHVPLPEVSLDKVHIALARSGCFGSCPAYRVDVYGDGRVVYDGEFYANVLGKHDYRIPIQDVTRLVDSLRAKDLWSLRPKYQAQVIDMPTFVLTMDMGGQVHKLVDYAGAWVGMPSAVSDFEQEVDRTARSDQWIHLSREAVERLKAEGFKFDSQQGANLLEEAMTGGNDDALLALIELGAPIEGADLGDERYNQQRGSLLEQALRGHRTMLVAPLIAKGALSTNGKPDQKKIDAAFRAAIAGGRMVSVGTIWHIRGDRPHPALSFDEADYYHLASAKSAHRVLPVTLLLSDNRYQEQLDSRDGKSMHWDGLAIAKWLIAKGCDVKAASSDGTTLLQIAVAADDVEFVRYLLGQGLDLSGPGFKGSRVLDDADSEDVAMLLLQAGIDVPGSAGGSGWSFRGAAESKHWQRVVEWLDAHHQG